MSLKIDSVFSSKTSSLDERVSIQVLQCPIRKLKNIVVNYGQTRSFDFSTLKIRLMKKYGSEKYTGLFYIFNVIY